MRAAAREAATIAGALALCPLVALRAPAVRTGALERGTAIAHGERALGLFPEPALHAWAAPRPGLLHVAWALYVFAHLPAIIGALTWAWLERPAAYAAARRTFLLAQGLTVLGYVLLPSAPPRAVPVAGGAVAAADDGAETVAHLVQSPWAALPSGHVVFAAVAAGIVIACTRHVAARGVAALYVVLVVLVTLVTGNHFWVDAAAGLGVAALAAALVLLPGRVGPRLVAAARMAPSVRRRRTTGVATAARGADA